ncbi:4Fe-4S dicluster domain-containing protein [uncultured Methanofollis sp.]|uniref:4Fe-4S dicluster domain-containing protein n=1 Tax=uncultured Methanofollis sp. TaxID=262500 RepID=UPI0026376628|nr:4Fe-4S dicluster domain-containing protein [uncultured Methanofollis sp.]
MTSTTKRPAGGVLPQKEKGFVSIRVRAPAGVLTAEQMEAVAAVSTRFGRGDVALTLRLNAEVPWVRREDVPAAVEILESAGLAVGSTGATVRAVVACKGTFCRHGIVDTQALARAIEARDGGRALPRKLKVGIAGCPNNCARVQFNDIGLMGEAYPVFDTAACTLCGACAHVCREGGVDVVEDRIHFSADACIGCGDCTAICPSGAATTETSGVVVYLGGMAGRHIRTGIRATGPLGVGNVTTFIGRAIDYFAGHAEIGERFGDMMERIGKDEVVSSLTLPGPDRSSGGRGRPRSPGASRQ